MAKKGIKPAKGNKKALKGSSKVKNTKLMWKYL